MTKVFQVLLKPTKAQKRAIDNQIEEHRYLYNSCLSKKIDAWNTSKTSLSGFSLIKSEIPLLKDRKSSYSSLQQTVLRLDKTYKSFFSRRYGFPRFKNRDRFKTIEFIFGDGCGIRNNNLYFLGIGQVRSFREFPSLSIKRISITKRPNGYYANITHEVCENVSVEKRSESVGLDFGLKTFITTSDGQKFDSPKFHKQSLKEEGKVHRRIHKVEKGSRLRAKHKRSLEKIKRKTANRRKDFNHKLSKSIVNNYKLIVVENISLSELKSEIRNINRTYRDVAFGQFRTFLTYKAESAGKCVIKVDPKNTTKECFNCGSLVEKKLIERIHKCSCGYTEDRDINAAKNILRRGLASLDRS